MIEGRMMVGRFNGVTPVSRKDGTTVAGMYEMQIAVRRGERDVSLKLSYFLTDLEGDPTPIKRSLEALRPQAGDAVVVRFTTTTTLSNGKPYFNDTPLSIMSLADALSGAAGKVAANGNGSKPAAVAAG